MALEFPDAFPCIRGVAHETTCTFCYICNGLSCRLIARVKDPGHWGSDRVMCHTSIGLC